MTRKIEFLDTSLRDGEQTPGVNFSVKEKVAPGVCSPSRRLVSRNSIFRVINDSFSKIQGLL